MKPSHVAQPRTPHTLKNSHHGDDDGEVLLLICLLIVILLSFLSSRLCLSLVVRSINSDLSFLLTDTGARSS